jgi:hypothetical protein
MEEYLQNTATAEVKITTQVTSPVLGALDMKTSTFHEPFYPEIDPSVEVEQQRNQI